MYISLRIRLLLIFTLVLTIPFLTLSLLVPEWFGTIMEKKTTEATVEMMDQFSQYSDSLTSQVEDLGKQVLVNPATQEWVRSEENGLSDSDLLYMKNQLKTELSSMMVNNSKSMSVSVYLNDGTGTSQTLPPLREIVWFKEFYDYDQRWMRSHHEWNEDEVNSYLLPLFDLNTMDLSGVIKVNFPTILLEESLEKVKLGDEGHVSLLDAKGRDVLGGNPDISSDIVKMSLHEMKDHSGRTGVVEVTKGETKHLVFYQKMGVGDWILMSEIKKSDLYAPVHSLQRNLLLISGWIFLLTILISYILSSNIVKPLWKLTESMKLVEKGKFSEAEKGFPAIRTRNDEIGYAVKAFKNTTKTLDQLIKTEYQEKIRRKDAEYKALLLQINPHFLNNTLEVIGGLSAQGENRKVIDVTVHLGRMLSYSLDTERDVVTIREEINYMRRYTEVLKLRHEDALQIQIEEDPALDNVPIIKFVLQPLVENAVKYSFIRNDVASIGISTRKVGDEAVLIVEDNGIGIPGTVIKELAKIDRNENNVLDSRGKSIGLKNVLGRLKLSYGNRFSYSIENKDPGGTRITLIIAMEKEESEE
ncbi:sensor histidine kinase [Rossellomorea marisflavi]|uniref:sensor histidine kinase n=1 Tax=Rossellomorea marisflavi TaxID=189381 RepID=UPI00064FC952|nr:sensor histidine kinase [Rossellomorea marisflavi]KML27702.1 histidine kinase [Rossellomorea marisflavi]